MIAFIEHLKMIHAHPSLPNSMHGYIYVFIILYIIIYIGYINFLQVSGIRTHSENSKLFSVLLQLIHRLTSLVLPGATTPRVLPVFLSVNLTR